MEGYLFPFYFRLAVMRKEYNEIIYEFEYK